MEIFLCKNLGVLQTIYRVVDSSPGGPRLLYCSSTNFVEALQDRLKVLQNHTRLTDSEATDSERRSVFRSKMLLKALDSVRGWAGRIKEWTRRQSRHPLGAEKIARVDETGSVTMISERIQLESSSHALCPIGQEQETQSRCDEEVDKQELIEAITQFAVATDDAQSIMRYLVVVEIDQ